MESKEIEIKFPKRKALVIGNLQFHSSYDFHLTKQEEEAADQELNKSEVSKCACLQKLKERLESSKKFRCRTDDAYLLRYLRWTKYDCDECYTAIKKLYSLRNKYPELFQLPGNFEFLMNNFICTISPYRDEKGRLIFCVDFRRLNLDEISSNSLFIAMNAFSDIISMNPHLQVNGFVGIWDFRGVTVRHMSLIKDPITLWLWKNLFQDCYPWRIQQIVGIHCSPLIRTTFNMIRMLFKKKIAERIKMIGSDMTELHQYVNPAVLPKEYGGTLEQSEYSITDFIIDNLPYLEYERSFGLLSSS